MASSSKQEINDPPAYSAASTFKTAFASVSLHMSDRIRFVQFPKEDIESIRATILRWWPNQPQIQHDGPYACSYEFKLKGRPWSGSGTGSDAVPAQILMREILATLYSRGWVMTTSTDVSRKKLDKDTLIFRNQSVPPPPASWVAISFKQDDKIRFNGAPKELIDAMAAMLKSMGLLQNQQVKDVATQKYEFKIMGSPWRASGEATMQTRLLLLRLLETLEQQGWSLYASIDQNNGPSDDSSYSETDCWYCIKANDWTPGSAIIHR